MLDRVIDYRGKAPNKASDGVPLITAKNIREGYIDFNSGKEFIPNNGYEGWMCRGILKTGDVLFTTEAPLGNVAMFPKRGKYALAQRVVTLRCNQATLAGKYLLYYFLSSRGHNSVCRLSTGSTALGIRQRTLKTVLIPLPSLPEQKKISEILSAWDEAIDQARKLIEAKKHRKKALMQQLLTGKKRLAGFNESWKEHRLGKLFYERRESNHDHLVLLGITGSRGVIPASEIERKDSSSTDKSKYKRIAPGDIGYNTMRMWQGVSAVSDLEGIVSPAYTICIPKENVDVSFMGYFFKFPPVINLFRRFSQGLVSDTLNLKFYNFAQIKVKSPDLEEQQAISKILRIGDDEIKKLKTNLRRSKNKNAD